MPESNNYLDFEWPIIEAEQEILGVKKLVKQGDVSKISELEKLERKLEKLRGEIFGNLTAYQKVRLSRHPERPFTLDYIERFIDEFIELHGDRLFFDDGAIIGGLGEFRGQSVIVVGHQRGRSIKERVKCNFGMAQPEGNRKAQRLFKLAEKFDIPLLLFIDTQGAYPGLEAEARGQAEAIARSLFILAELQTPIISAVIGEGGSGGALALGVCDRLIMLENSIYSVITPEGCASILWGKKGEQKDATDKASEVADSLKLDALSLYNAGVVDEVVEEPIGGAHRNFDEIATRLGDVIEKHLAELNKLSRDKLMETRYQKYRNMGSVNE